MIIFDLSKLDLIMTNDPIWQVVFQEHNKSVEKYNKIL